jgi:dihydrofolate synthase/folylpolyglutamate synthase
MSIEVFPGVPEDVTAYLEARNAIDVELVSRRPRRRDDPGKVRAVREFNERLGNPQAACPAIQVAGTSGKGSVALHIARILLAAGYRTGLHVSPYLQVATEKSWVDGQYAAPTDFHRAYLAVQPVAKEFQVRPDCPASVHGMASLGVTWQVFRQQRLDWAVVETGVGGRFDLVQGLDRRLAVITDIGIDHVRHLGSTLEEIAWHKAGIMEGCEMAVAVRAPATWEILRHEAKRYRCRLLPVDAESEAPGTALADPLWPAPLPPGGGAGGGASHTTSAFPHRNVAVAVAAATALRQMGLRIDDSHLASALAQPPMPGRLEVVQEAPLVLLDGAHNGQKITGLVHALGTASGLDMLAVTGDHECKRQSAKCKVQDGQASWASATIRLRTRLRRDFGDHPPSHEASAGLRRPSAFAGRFGGTSSPIAYDRRSTRSCMDLRLGPAGRTILVVAITGERHAGELAALAALRPAAVVATQPLLYEKPAMAPAELARRLSGLAPVVVARPTPHAAVTTALDMAGKEDRVLVTGSLYLVGQARNLWYPWQSVLLQRTGYPTI